METAGAGRDERGPFRDKHAVQCQNAFRRIIRKAEDRGMKVNEGKTAMACVSGALKYEARAHIMTAEGDLIQSGDSIKVLGFRFSNRPNICLLYTSPSPRDS